MTFSLDEVTTEKSSKEIDLTPFEKLQISTLVNNEENLSPSTIKYNKQELKTRKYIKNSALDVNNLPEKVFSSDNFSTAIPQTRRRRHHRRK